MFLHEAQWSQANLQVDQSLVEIKILERPGVAFSVTRFKPDLKYLVGFKKAVAARKPSNITELEAFAHEEWAKIPIERCKKLVLSYLH